MWFELLILIYLLLFFTPTTLVNFLFGIIIVTIRYKDQNNNVYEYSFSHNKYDGMLMSHYIKNNMVMYKKSIDNGYERIYVPISYQGPYSPFTIAVASIIRKIIDHQNRDLTIGIIVSTRDKMIEQNIHGNYITVATYKVNKNDDIETICNKQVNTINKIKENNIFPLNISLKDLFSGLSCDYVFNSWKMLSKIKTIDNRELQLIQRKEITNQDIANLYRVNRKQQIVLSYIDQRFAYHCIKTYF